MSLTLLLLVASLGYGQGVITENGITFNRATPLYQEIGYLATTANDTTNFITFRPAIHLAFLASVNDSATIVANYQLRNSTLGENSAWAELDTTIETATGTSVTGGIAMATFQGYDQIRFYFDYLSGTAAGDGTSNNFTFYYYFLRP